MDLSKAMEKPRVMRALSGLNPQEFENLARTFAEVWEEHTQENWQGQRRARAKGAGPKAGLESAEQKLFFILFYLHNYPTQEVMGYLFGFEQPQANKWIMRLLPLLQRALERQLALPERRTEQLEKLLAECTAEARLFLDGTDRPVRRPKDPDKQKDRYSGRKKRHTVKNLILTRERTATFLSSTRPGRESDKRLAEALQSVAFPKGSVLITDLGFEGLSIQNAALIQAAKKPKGGQLSSALKLFNRIVAGARVRVEHVISSIKRCNILRDTFRHMKEGYEDLVMEVACGLHNFREAHRSGSPPGLSPLQCN